MPKRTSTLAQSKPPGLLTFTVPGPAIPERKRQVRNGSWTRRIDTKPATEYKALVRLCAANAMAGAELYAGPLSVWVTVSRLKPKSWPKTRNQPTTRPDLEDYSKLVCDACTGIVWVDDAQIVQLHLLKCFAEREEILVRVFALDGDGEPITAEGASE